MRRARLNPWRRLVSEIRKNFPTPEQPEGEAGCLGEERVLCSCWAEEAQATGIFPVSIKKLYSFISGCTASSLLHVGFLQSWRVGATVVVGSGLLVAVVSRVDHGL